MTKLCPRGKAAAKRKFKVYPSAYANAYASKICAGKIKDPSGVKRKDFRGPKPTKAMGGRIYKAGGGVAEAAAKLIEMSKGKVAAFIFVINLFDLKGCENLIKKSYKVENLIEFPGH